MFIHATGLRKLLLNSNQSINLCLICGWQILCG